MAEKIKKQTNDEMADAFYKKLDEQKLSPTDNPTVLIDKLAAFYKLYPDYETGVMDIWLLMRLTHQEFDKFVRRPHKQVTQFYFDK